MTKVSSINTGFERTTTAPEPEATYESDLATQLEREMERSKELWTDMVREAATSKKIPSTKILQRISPDLEIPPDDALNVFEQDVAQFRRTLAATATLERHHSRRAEMWGAYNATNEKDYFKEARAEIEELQAHLKELNKAAAEYTRANYLLVSHDSTINRAARDNTRIFPGGRAEIFKLAGKKDPVKSDTSKSKRSENHD